MSQQFKSQIRFVLVCSIALFVMAFLFNLSPGTAQAQATDNLHGHETTGTQLLWESLPSQFLSSLPR